MAKTISQLPLAAPIDGTELVEVVQGGTSKQADVNAFLPAGYIDGLKMVRVSGTALTLTTGAAFVPGAGQLVRVTADIAKTGLSLTASTWYHVYLDDGAGTPDFVLSTTAPSTPYNGTARTKTGDTSRRYVGSVKTDTSGNIYDFLHLTHNGLVMYQTSIYTAPFQVLSGTATAATNVSCSGVVPVTSKAASLFSTNNDASAVALFGNSISPPSSSPIQWMANNGPNSSVSFALVLDGNQAFSYMYFSAPTANVVVRVAGYYFER